MWKTRENLCSFELYIRQMREQHKVHINIAYYMFSYICDRLLFSVLSTNFCHIVFVRSCRSGSCKHAYMCSKCQKWAFHGITIRAFFSMKWNKISKEQCASICFWYTVPNIIIEQGPLILELNWVRSTIDICCVCFKSH